MKKTFLFITCLLIIALQFSCQKRHGSPKSMEKEFIGNWKTASTDEKGANAYDIYITLNEDMTATNVTKNNKSGTWKVVAERAEIKWSDGWRDFIFKADNDYYKLGYAPNLALDKEATNHHKVKKVDALLPLPTSQPSSANKP